VATGAQAIAAGNPGCAMQISAHVRDRSLPVYHPMTLLDLSQRNQMPKEIDS
jgi:glycolate oxidase iron-sulfur subunit